jgi:DNA-binding response OmpR family regulator
VETKAGRILVIEDEGEVQRVVKRAAEAAGFEVVQAFDGAPGLALAAAEPFDLILLDINMPNMDGRDVLTRLKRDPATAVVPVLVYSGRDNNEYERHDVLGLGAEDYVDKPLDARSLVLKIEYLIQKARARQTHEGR